MGFKDFLKQFIVFNLNYIIKYKFNVYYWKYWLIINELYLLLVKFYLKIEEWGK